MTVIVGIRCEGGVVLGADSMVSYGAALGQQQTIKQQAEKLYVIGQDVVLGTSGPVGLGQSYNSEVVSKVKNTGNRAKWKSVPLARKDLTKAMWDHAGKVWDRASVVAKTVGMNIALQEANHETLIALPVKDEPCLLGFSHQYESVEYDQQMPIVSIGSGQLVADPFLAFIRRIFWPNSLPAINDGVFAAVWALTHTITSQPGGVGEPIQVVTLANDKGNWRVEAVPSRDLDEHRIMIQDMQEEMRKVSKKTFSEPPKSPIPEQPHG
jgi:ATP-dependent protease HslVU (ClpYQ) peptidase subunit